MKDLGSPHDDASANDGLLVHFPPGLGLVPPRELDRVPRPRSADGQLVG